MAEEWTQRVVMTFEAADDDHLIDETLDRIRMVLIERGHTVVDTKKIKSVVRSLDWRTG